MINLGDRVMVDFTLTRNLRCRYRRYLIGQVPVSFRGMVKEIRGWEAVVIGIDYPTGGNEYLISLEAIAK